MTTLQSHDQPRVGYEIEKHIFTSQTDPAPFANASTSSLYAYPTVVHVAKQPCICRVCVIMMLQAPKKAERCAEQR